LRVGSKAWRVCAACGDKEACDAVAGPFVSNPVLRIGRRRLSEVDCR